MARDTCVKKIFIFVLILIFSFPEIVFANGAGLPPFFKINGKYSISNPLQLLGITAQSFVIPQDFTADNYLVNQPINFEVDDQQLLQVIRDENILQHNTYDWDFGDGTKAEGLKNTHTYTKIGSYILILTINVYPDPNSQPARFIDSFLLNILPDKHYTHLPHAVISLNNKQVTDPLNAQYSANFNQPIAFDGSESNASVKIVQHLWNFGDGQTSTQEKTTHIFNQQYQPHYVVVVYRIIDANGFISDAFVPINHDPNIHNTNGSQSIGLVPARGLMLLIAAAIAVIFLVFITRKFVMHRTVKQ